MQFCAILKSRQFQQKFLLFLILPQESSFSLLGDFSTLQNICFSVKITTGLSSTIKPCIKPCFVSVFCYALNLVCVQVDQ